MGPGCGGASGDSGLLGIMIAVFITFVIAIAFVSWSIYESSLEYEARDLAALHSKFRPGEMVKTHIANFRGVITDRRCEAGSCDYAVRFPVNSMEPVWMGETELEAIR